ncbi:MAG: ACT domain-containing protein [Marinibacterium sp.]|nr:ACT domain-containing protein [Marinibacterium sp.]
MPDPVRNTRAMIAGMAPVLEEAEWCFVTGADPALAALALASFQEDEGLSLILPLAVVRDQGLAVDLTMRRIKLSVHSALDGVGLTAAAATALAEAGIACNMVAAYHHDHAFVPAGDADRAVSVLQALIAQHQGG